MPKDIDDNEELDEFEKELEEFKRWVVENWECFIKKNWRFLMAKTHLKIYLTEEMLFKSISVDVNER